MITGTLHDSSFWSIAENKKFDPEGTSTGDDVGNLGKFFCFR